MLIKGILNGDLINYKKPAMVIEFPFCDFKCERECGEQMCQNSALTTAANIDLSTNKIIWKYFKDEIPEVYIDFNKEGIGKLIIDIKFNMPKWISELPKDNDIKLS